MVFGSRFLGIIAFVFGFIQDFIDIRVMHDHCETRKTVKSKNNNISAKLIVCIVIRQSKTHNRILEKTIPAFTFLRAVRSKSLKNCIIFLCPLCCWSSFEEAVPLFRDLTKCRNGPPLMNSMGVSKEVTGL